MKPRKTEEVDGDVEVEVLPREPVSLPGDEGSWQRKTTESIAHLMDDLIRIPGTRIRFGLDPILGLFPGAGDLVASIVGSIGILESVRSGVPRIVLARMALNVLINGLLGAIPVAGDAFSVWFKSNARNYRLLVEHSGRGQSRNRRGDWAFVIVVLGVMLTLLAFAFGGLIVMGARVAEALSAFLA